MPQIGEKIKVLPEDRQIIFDHKQEKATPYYYSVNLPSENKKNIKAEISAASRCALFRFTFPKSNNARLIIQGINLNPKLNDWCNDYGPRLQKIKGWIKIDPDKNEIVGYNPDRQAAQIGPELPNFKGYFIIRFNKKYKISEHGANLRFLKGKQNKPELEWVHT